MPFLIQICVLHLGQKSVVPWPYLIQICALHPGRDVCLQFVIAFIPGVTVHFPGYGMK